MQLKIALGKLEVREYITSRGGRTTDQEVRSWELNVEAHRLGLVDEGPSIRGEIDYNSRFYFPGGLKDFLEFGRNEGDVLYRAYVVSRFRRGV